MPMSRLMLNVANDREQIETLFDKIYNMFQQDATEHKKLTNQVCTGAAIKAGVNLLEDQGKCHN